MGSVKIVWMTLGLHFKNDFKYVGWREKGWASSTRRGGMTVLGKVAVPKPLNLPSQRLENHGLDPSVEIVPKGTLSWGSRSSSSASNAWGSSALSPNTDGGTSSPSYLSGRPSSGGGTRPSTAGSDRMHEPTPNAWGQNSRPSSASGVLTSNQTALASRPRSAETRPGSSQLSRFAEPSSDNSVAWGPTGVSEKLGVATSKKDGFSLSSGDFPTLGSEKDNSGKSPDSQDHGSYSRPGSSSGGAASGKEKSVTSSVGDISVNANVRSGNVSTWRRDGSHHVEDGVQPTMEKWKGDPSPYLNPNFPPHHFDAWRGPPINPPPPGVWYGGPPRGPPYGPPLAPGGFPIEPFPYYHPQIPPPPLANSQPIPPPGAGPRGHHPKNGDLHRPHIPDAYIRPDMPIRPGFYPGPMAYEGYFRPPMGYCNSNERDIPFMGMVAPPAVYNRYPGENPTDPGNNHARASMHGSMGKPSASEHAESGHPDDTRGPYKVLKKPHNEWDEKRAEDKREHGVPANAQYLEKGDQLRTSLPKNEWGLEDREDEENYSGKRTSGGDARSRNFDNRGTSSSDSVKVKLPESRGKAKTIDDVTVTKSETAASTFPQVPPQIVPSTPKDPTLIQKIEGLNAKARTSDGWPDTASIPCREEQKSRLQVDAMASRSASETGTAFERTHSHEVDISTAHKALQPTASSGAAILRKASHGVQGRLDHRGKRFNNTHDAGGLRKKPLAAESVCEVSAVNSEPSFDVHVQDHLTSVEATEKPEINPQGKDEGESLTPVLDESDSQAQRAKMREIAKQRAKQLQEEEEERIREQRAKALAKLEELNRRTQTMDGSTQKLEKGPPSGPIQQEQEPVTTEVVVMVASKSETVSSPLVSNPNAQIRESNTVGIGESTVMSEDTRLETSDNVHAESVVSHDQLLHLQQDSHTAGAANHKAARQGSEGSVSRHKRMGYKQKQNAPLGKNLIDKSVPISSTEAPKDETHVAVNDVAGEVGSTEPILPMNSNITAESSAHQRRKNSRSSKNKHKLDDVLSVAALPLPVSKETNAAKVSTESGKPKASELELDPSSVQSRTGAKEAIPPSELPVSVPSEEAGGRINSQWKPQYNRRMPRNQQANRTAEKSYSSDAVVWAPVRSQNKTEVMDEAGKKTVPDTVNAAAKSDNSVQNNMKSRRAEIERYVPKPVAKELAQQGSIQQQPVPSSVNQITSEETVGRVENFQNVEGSQLGNSVIGNELRNADGKQNKQSKAHGSWRQRGLEDGSSSTSHPSKNVEKSVEQYQSLKPDINSLKEQTKSSDDFNTSDGWGFLDNSETKASVIASAVVKDQEVTGRGKRHPFKGHRSIGNNRDHDYRNANSGYTDEIGQTDTNIALKENRGVGERITPHWQPKSQVYSVHSQRGNRPSSGQNATVDDSLSPKRVNLSPQHDKERRETMVQPPIDQSVSEQTNVAELLSLGQHQESKRERKVASANVDTQHEQQFASGFRKNGNQNNRSGRGHESRGDWSSAGQDNRQHGSTSSNRERQRHNSHYEYQPIGQYNNNNNNKTNNFEGPTDGSHNMGSRYRERSQGHSRRGGGNFYGRQSGTAHVDAGYD
ncbi:unnamed protein product [Camellia sinensis]